MPAKLLAQDQIPKEGSIFLLKLLFCSMKTVKFITRSDSSSCISFISSSFSSWICWNICYRVSLWYFCSASIDLRRLSYSSCSFCSFFLISLIFCERKKVTLCGHSHPWVACWAHLAHIATRPPTHFLFLHVLFGWSKAFSGESYWCGPLLAALSFGWLAFHFESCQASKPACCWWIPPRLLRSSTIYAPD